MKIFYYNLTYKLKPLIYFSVIILTIHSCVYKKVSKHVTLNIDKDVTINKSGEINEIFFISSTQLISILEGDAEIKNAELTNIQVEDVKFKFTLATDNTAALVSEAELLVEQVISNPQGGTTIAELVKKNKSWLLINKGTEILLNQFLETVGVGAVEEQVSKHLKQLNSGGFNIRLKGKLPAGTFLRGNFKIVFRISLDAVYCEKFPIGFGGGDECIIFPYVKLF